LHRLLARDGEGDHGAMAIASITIDRVTTTALHRPRLAAGTGCTWSRPHRAPARHPGEQGRRSQGQGLRLAYERARARSAGPVPGQCRAGLARHLTWARPWHPPAHRAQANAPVRPPTCGTGSNAGSRFLSWWGNGALLAMVSWPRAASCSTPLPSATGFHPL